MKQSLLSVLSLSLMTTYTFANKPETPMPHPVGSCYGDGIVFYVNKAPNAPQGKHGLIVALEDVSNSDYFYWDLSRTAVSTSALYFTGESNTRNIIDTLPKNTNMSAAEAADAYNRSEAAPPFTPWYLPSRDELALLYLQASNRNNFWSNAKCPGNPLIPEVYWSSSQYDSWTAWYVDFVDGRVLQYPGARPARVRAVRAF